MTAWRSTVRRQRVYAGDPKIRLAALHSYWGGRVEAYRRGVYVGSVVERDVVSLYPHAAVLQPLPHAGTRWRRVSRTSDVRDLEGFGRFWFRFPSDQKFPCLPVGREDRQALVFPSEGETSCTFSEIRAACDLGAEVHPIEAFGFEPGESECRHDVGEFMRHFLIAKAQAPKGSLDYQVNKLILNALVGKAAEQRRGSGILSFERKARESGHPGLGALIAGTPVLRDALGQPLGVGAMWSPEWATLILGCARALMAPIVARGALLVSTDSVIVPRDLDISCAALDELRAVGSDMPVQVAADAVFIARSRLYALLRRTEDVTIADDVLTRDDRWAVVRAARHGTQEKPVQFADTVLRCLAAGRDVAPERSFVRLRSAESAARDDAEINSEVHTTGRTHFRWDGKRILLDRDVNPFTSVTDTQPYSTVARLSAAELQRVVKRSRTRPRRRRAARARLDVAQSMLTEGHGVREVARATGIPRSTVSDLRRRIASPTKPKKEK